MRSPSIAAVCRVAVAVGFGLLLLAHSVAAEDAGGVETHDAETEVGEAPSAQDAPAGPPAESDPPPESTTPEPDGPDTEGAESGEDTEPETAHRAPAAEDWSERVDVLAEQIRTGASEPEEADALYHDLADALWAYQDEVYDALRNRSPDALKRRAILTEMYAARVQLLSWVTPELRDAMIGGGSRGMREIVREFDNAKLDFFFQTLAIPRGLRRMADSARESPLDDLWRLIQLLFGVVVFRTWRRWAKEGLGKARSRILAIQPQTNAHLHAAQLLWYLHRFRGPLEWLALLFFASAIFEPGDLEEVSTLLWVVVLWLLLTRFGLLLVDAMASRSIDGPSSQNATLRLRSLRLVATWIVFAGLGLDLSSRYVGDGAIHAWVERVFLLLLAPVLFLLLRWWRSEIIERLKEEARRSDVARRMGKRERGLVSYFNAAAGALYLFGAELLQFSIRILSGFEGGRKVVAMLLRREVERDGKRESVSEHHISDELTLRLLTPAETAIVGPFRDGLERLEKLTKTNRGATVAVLAERGGGMSTFLRLLKEDLGESMRIVDCPPGGYESFREALADEFDLNRTADLTTELRPRLDALGVRVVAVDNFHRISRPMMGGLAGIEESGKLTEGAGEDITWIVAVTRAAWPYITRARGDRAILQEVLELPAWSDSQLEELFDTRCKLAEVEPDYRRLVFPRQFDDGERTTLEERNRFGFRRVLWELSDGNPEVAIRLFCDSLRELPSGKLIVRLPQPASSGRVAAANLTTLLTLRGLVECEVATIGDLTASIRVSRSTVVNAIGYCIQEGWVEEVHDYYQITWDWYRTIKRVLVRRNLIAR